MTLGHEKIDVYRLSLGYVAWVEGVIASEKIPSHTGTQNSIPIAISIRMN
jgi:hypothetical protein